MLVLLYLAAIVSANLLVAKFGPSVTLINAFLFIGLDITTRDALHERWHKRYLWPKMAILILSGSMLSYWLNEGARQIALASAAAFLAAGSVDAISYSLLGKHARFVRVNGSNIFSAAVDSLIFPTVAFGSFLWPIVLGQFAAKVLGGLFWSLVISVRAERTAPKTSADQA